MSIPRGFLLSLARRHADTLRRILFNMTQLTLEDVQCVCELFPRLEELSCAVASRDAVRSYSKRFSQHLYRSVGVDSSCNQDGT